jgi:hypothetical protein
MDEPGFGRAAFAAFDRFIRPMCFCASDYIGYEGRDLYP